MSISELRTITTLTTQAAAALVPLASDGRGSDSHGGRITNPEAVLDGALRHLIEAGALAAQIRANATESGEVLN